MLISSLFLLALLQFIAIQRLWKLTKPHYKLPEGWHTKKINSFLYLFNDDVQFIALHCRRKSFLWFFFHLIVLHPMSDGNFRRDEITLNIKKIILNCSTFFNSLLRKFTSFADYLLVDDDFTFQMIAEWWQFLCFSLSLEFDLDPLLCKLLVMWLVTWVEKKWG